MVVGLLAVTLALAGCQTSDNDRDETGMTSVAVPGFSELSALENPKEYQGPSTAVIADSGIHPLTLDATPVLPVTVTDSQGTSVTVSDVSRILPLDLYGTLSRIVFDLGLGDKVVGRDTSTTFPEALELPMVTANGHNLNAESILDLNPSVILTDTSLGPWDVILQLRDAGVPIVVVDSSRSIEGVESLIMEVATSLGVAELGTQLAERSTLQVDTTITQIAEFATVKNSERLRMAFLYVRGQANVYYLFGQGSGADSLITALNGVSVAEEIGWEGMRPVTDEGLIAAQPDLILMMSDGLESAGGVDALLERLPALGQTPAGQRRRIVDMADNQILAFGPVTADVLAALARAIYAPNQD